MTHQPGRGWSAFQSSQPRPGTAPILRFDLAVFDFDGTLADSGEWFFHCLNEAAERFGFRTTTPEEHDALRHRSTRDIIHQLQVPKWRLPAIARYMRHRATEHIDTIHMFDGIPQALLTLHQRGVQLAIVTSNTEPNVRRVLGDQVAGCIGFYGCGSSLFGKAAKLKHAIRYSKALASRTVYVGDETRDIEAARAAGASSAAVTWGYAAPEALIRSRPTVVLERVEQLTDL